MSVAYDKPVLTLGQVREMQEEREKLARDITALQDKVAALDKRLAAAALFMEDAESRAVLGPAKQRANGASEQEPMTEAVERILRSNPRPMNMKEIKWRLAEEGFSKSRLDNYVYTVMNRLVEKNRISRSGKLFSAATRRSAEANGAPNGNA